MKTQRAVSAWVWRLSVFLGAACAADVLAEGWKPAPAPLTTPWAKDVSPASPRPEYPRPQLVRTDWMSLNGLWDFAFDDAGGRTAPGKILVPFTFESALSGIGKGGEAHSRVWYRRAFERPLAWAGKRILLHFGAVDWRADVQVNGKPVGTHTGGFAPFSFDITEALKAGGPQELTVSVYDPDELKDGGWQPKGKQLGSKGIWYTRSTGIWQSVWLEPVSEDHITSVRAEPDLAGGNITLHVATRGAGARRVSAVVSLNGTEVARTEGSSIADGTVTLAAAVKAPRPWSPESPVLYDISLTLGDADRPADRAATYTAFRTVGMKDGRLTLNGSPYFLRAVLDQGYWPEGIYTAPTDEALRSDVEMTKAFGFNCARKHAKVEDPRWYWHCDKLGLLVVQDMPSSQGLAAREAKENFTAEWREVVDAVRRHPCVVMWVPFNENWGEPGAFQDEIVELTRTLDRTRPIIDASGWTQRGKTDVVDIHDYTNDLRRHAVADAAGRPKWIGEYGGVALPVPGHTWVKGWGYQLAKTPADLVERYRFLTGQINNAPGLSGFVYTQLTDVEQELNGLMTYDRRPKADPARFAEINRGSGTASK